MNVMRNRLLNGEISAVAAIKNSCRFDRKLCLLFRLLRFSLVLRLDMCLMTIEKYIYTGVPLTVSWLGCLHVCTHIRAKLLTDLSRFYTQAAVEVKIYISSDFALPHL